MKRAAIAVCLFPFLAAFGPGNCTLNDDLYAEPAVDGTAKERTVDEEAEIVIPRGVAVILDCEGSCRGGIGVDEYDEEILYASPTVEVDDPEADRQVTVLIGLAEGRSPLRLFVGDLVYELDIRVTAAPAEAQDALRVIELE